MVVAGLALLDAWIAPLLAKRRRALVEPPRAGWPAPSAWLTQSTAPGRNVHPSMGSGNLFLLNNPHKSPCSKPRC